MSAPSTSTEIDLLAPLSPLSLLKVAACCLLGGVLGLGAGKVLLKRAQSKAVMRVGTYGLIGPVVPLSEVKARAESFSATVEDLARQGVANAENEARRYSLTAEVDQSRDGTVVTLTTNGPEEAATLALCRARIERLMAVTHAAYVQSSQARDASFAMSTANAEALQKAGANAVDPAATAAFERWAGELAAARHDAEREVLLSRDSEIIDAAYLVDLGARRLLLAAVGAFAGLLLGLALTARPVRAP